MSAQTSQGDGTNTATAVADPQTQSPQTPAEPQPVAQQQPAATPAPTPQAQSPGVLTPEQQAIADSVSKAIADGMAPVVQRIDQIENRLNQATAPAQQVQQQPAPQPVAVQQPQQQQSPNASMLFGGSGPAVRQGENVLSSRGYSVQQAARFSSGECEAQEAKLEVEMHRQLLEPLKQMGFQQAGRGQTRLIVPISEAMIPHQIASDVRQSVGGITELMKQSIIGNDGADIAGRLLSTRQGLGEDQETLQAMKQALSIFDETKLAGFLQPGPQGEFITLMRSLEVLSRAGASQVTLPPNGYLPYNRQTGSSTAYWVGENQTITSSEPTTGTLELRAKKIATRVNAPNELMMFGGSEVEALIRADMALSMSIAIDQAGLEGKGSAFTPLGITKSADIQTHTSSLTVAANGNTFNTDTPGAMLSNLEEKNFDTERDSSCNFVMRPKMWHENILERKDSNNAYMFTVAADVSGSAPNRLRGRNVLRSTQVPNNLTKGSATDLSYVLAGCFRHLVIGRIGVIEFATQVEGDTVFQNYQTGLRAVQHVDIGILRPDAFVLADKIDMDLPA